MSFKSIDRLIRRNSKTKLSRNIVDGIYDQKEEQYVQSLRELLLANNQLPEKFDDYHVLLRYANLFPIQKLCRVHSYCTRVIHLCN